MEPRPLSALVPRAKLGIPTSTFRLHERTGNPSDMNPRETEIKSNTLPTPFGYHLGDTDRLLRQIQTGYSSSVIFSRSRSPEYRGGYHQPESGY
ncbi:hypothetical protein N7488_003415 [Penicillium malachiteum]|nr:hypothetical protein N7488_003415 [Penicillium malachiteum]